MFTLDRYVFVYDRVSRSYNMLILPDTPGNMSTFFKITYHHAVLF